MLDKWIRETLQHRRAKLTVVLIIANSGDDLVKNTLLEKSGHLLVFQAFSHSLQTIQVSSQYHRCVSAV